MSLRKAWYLRQFCGIMVNLVYHVYKCTLNVKQEDVFKIVLVLVFQLLTQATGNILYVSKASGHDGTNSCKNITAPCKTLNHVINISSGNDVIKLDANNNEEVPYNKCPTTTKLITGKLGFYSWNGIAIINCSGKGLNFEGNPVNSTTIQFHHLKFLDTFLKAEDVSLTVNNCSLGSFEKNATLINLIYVLVNSPLDSLRINISSTYFLENNNAGSLNVVNNQRVPIFVEIRNVTISNNVLEKANYVISLQGYVNLDFANSEISNTKFSEKISEHAALVSFSACPTADTKNDRSDSTLGNSSQHERLGIKKHGSPIFDQQSPTMTFSLNRINFSSNLAGIVRTLFCTVANVNITDTTFFNNTNNSIPERAFVVIATSKTLGVAIKNSFFVKNNNNVNVDNNIGSIVMIVSQNLTFFAINCSFSHNHAGAIDISTLPSSIITIRNSVIQFSNSFTGHHESDRVAQIYVIFGNFLEDSWLSDDTQDSLNWPKKWIERSEKLARDGHQGFESKSGQSPIEYEETLESGLVIEDCEFYNNTGSYSSIAAEAWVSHTQVHIQRCVFVGNIADGSGAIEIAGNIGCSISDSTFLNNNGIYGSGAIGFSGSTLFVKNCTLDSNNGGCTESQATGSMSLTSGGSAFIQDSRIIQRNAVQPISKYGRAFHGTLGVSSDEYDNVTLSNSTLDYQWSPSLEKVIVVEIAHTNKFVLENGTEVQCPWGYKIKHSMKRSVSPPAQSFECALCTMGSYTIDRGVYRNKTSNSVECLFCPYGGRCVKGLEVLPNFWGYKIQTNPPTIQFSRCPIGYCCQISSSQKGCVPYHTCNSGRHGRLCGACMPGYTETLFTPSCRKSEKCKDYWFWPMAVIFVLCFTLYLIIQPDIPGILHRSITWFRATLPQVTELSSTHLRTEELSEETSISGIERIVFFYYQAIDILSVQGSYNTIWDSHLTQFILGLFNFDMRLNREGFACPFPGLNPISKLLFHSLGVFSVLFAIPCIFLLHKAMSLCFPGRVPKNGLYLSAFLKSVFLGYTVLARKSLTLLQCVVVDGVNCLFVNCNIECYTWWQTLIGTLVLIYFFPFVLVIFFGAKKLYKKQISVVHFFLACLFPLPFLSYWFLNRRRLGGKIVPDTGGRTAITSVLIGSYRVPDHVSTGAIYWESVLIGRMLVLILAAVLIKDPLLKSLTLLLFCIINLSLHIYVYPYERVLDNRAETLSLFSLVLMAMFNLPFMAYLSEGVVPSGPMSHVMDVFMWCQVALVGFLPLVCILLALAALISQAARLVFLLTKGVRFACTCFSSCRFCGGSRTQGELGDPLIG